MNVLKKQLAYACWYYHLSLRAHGPAAGNDLYWHSMVILNVYIYRLYMWNNYETRKTILVT